jgi:hypothetical protein
MRNVYAVAGCIAAGSALVLLCSSETVQSQSNEQSVTAEIVRKSTARDNEDGYCSRTGWAMGDNWERFKSWLETARIGTWKVNNFANGSCEYNRVTGVHYEGNKRCVSYSIWTCSRGGTCGTGRVVDCLDPSGKLDRRENE